ncbi:MAG: flagellin FliC [Gammaproteobacteria bacterium]|nr:flagellin FliC [Gammaproteobacteria bacterium]
MAQVINTNVASIGAQRYLNNSQASLHVSLQRLSSGLRINSAKDDAAGLSISEGLTKQIRGYTQATRNASDAVSMIQTAEGGLIEVGNMLQRIRELAVQSVNGNYTAVERSAMNAEVTLLEAEIDRVADKLHFNTRNVIGSGITLSFQVGAYAGDKIDVTLTNITSVYSGSGDSTNRAGGLGANGAAQVTTAALASVAITQMDKAILEVNNQRGMLGAALNRMESVIRTNENAVENLSASRSRILDADFAAETANLTRTQILQQAGSAMLTQANAIPQGVLSLLG